MMIKYLLIFLVSFGIVSADESTPSEPPATAIVIFGATGDLAAQKLVPALQNLDRGGELEEQTAIIAVGRRDYTDEAFRKLMREAVEKSPQPFDEALWGRFQKRITYLRADFDEDEGYERLRPLIEKKNRLFYLATQPSYFPKIVQKLSEHELIYDAGDGEKWSRVAIEKPFGRDLDSALALQELLSQYLDESQIYRVDHFLGKEGIQKLLSFRFEEALFEPLWNSRSIDQVQITLSEDIGIGSRANFWEETGLVRDLFQNHLMQILSLAAMEPPKSLAPADIHAEKIKLLNAIRPFPKEGIDRFAVSGQYGAGEVKGSSVAGYREEAKADSSVETFAAAKIYIDNERWKGVPFYLRAGKRLPVKTTEIAVLFKGRDKEKGHTLFIRIQPDAGIFLQKIGKTPEDLRPIVRLDAPSAKPAVEAYEKLFAACLKGDASLFVQGDEQIAAWRLWTPVIEHWAAHPSEAFPNYKAGTWGPKEAEELAQWEVLRE